MNVVAPWNLSHALLPKLKSSPSPRILNISGGGKPAAIDPTNLQAEKKFRGLMTYTHSKSILEAMSIALSKRLEPENVSVNIVFPGTASTSMTQSLTTKGLPGPMKIMMPFFKLFFRSDGGKGAHKASQSTVFAATDPSLEGVTGRYFDTKSKEKKLHPSAYDEQVQKQIVDSIEQSKTTVHPRVECLSLGYPTMRFSRKGVGRVSSFIFTNLLAQPKKRQI